MKKYFLIIEMLDIHNKNFLKNKRQKLRKNPTEPENRLWIKLKGKQFFGIKFRRQHSVGNYILDFYCTLYRLAIEIDGESHYEEPQVIYDNNRTKYLNSLHIKVLRFTNRDIMDNIEGVLQKIKEEIDIITTLNPS